MRGVHSGYVWRQKIQGQVGGGAAVWATLAAIFALLLIPATAMATPITSTGSYELTGQYAAANLAYENQPYSSNLYSATLSNVDLLSTLVNFIIPAVIIPHGAVITSATLTFALPALNSTGVAQLQDYQSVDDNLQGSSPPALVSYGSMVVSAANVASGSTTYVIPQSGASVDLLAAGFGPSILAGNDVDFQGFAQSTYISWGYYVDDNSPGINTGYNVDADFLLYAGFQPATVSATMNVDYQETSVPEPATSGMLLLGLAAIGLAMGARRRAGARS